jgi:hypothetical protein
MQQVKIFKGLESDVPDLERRINAFLAEKAASVIQITGNIAPQSDTRDDDRGHKLGGSYTPSDVLVIVLYEPK